MKVPKRWLDEFVDTGLSVEALANRLTMAGLEAEKITRVGNGWDNVFVGKVTEVTKHPDADRLVLATVEAGEHRLTVVTGAPNIAQGQVVPLALAGARLIDGHAEGQVYKTLKPGVIRGVRSEGMVCSEKELGLSDEHEGIMVLEPEAPIGAPLADWLGDTVIEFEITPNLAHDFSILGIAREAGALTDRPVHLPPVYDLASAPVAAADFVKVEATDLCARYVAVVIEGITSGHRRPGCSAASSPPVSARSATSSTLPITSCWNMVSRSTPSTPTSSLATASSSAARDQAKLWKPSITRFVSSRRRCSSSRTGSAPSASPASSAA